MPAYWLQTLGGGSYTTDWDFNRFKPDAVVINLGGKRRQYCLSAVQLLALQGQMTLVMVGPR
jgi:hypothetical protein